MTKLLAQDLNWANISTTYTPLTDIDPSQYVASFLQLGLIIIVVVCLLFLLFGGFRWITSKGEKEALQKSQKTISGAIIGLVIALAIFIILGLLSIFTHTNLFRICIPGIGQSCNIIYTYPFNDGSTYNPPGTPGGAPPPGLPVGPCPCINNLCAPLGAPSNDNGRCYSCQQTGWSYEPNRPYADCNYPLTCYTCP